MTTSGALWKESKMTRTKAKRRKHYLWNIDDHLISLKNGAEVNKINLRIAIVN